MGIYARLAAVCLQATLTARVEYSPTPYALSTVLRVTSRLPGLERPSGSIQEDKVQEPN